MNLKPLILVCLRWGGIAGILTTILMITTYYIAVHPFMVAPFLDFRILIFGVFIFFALKEFRDYKQGGLLYFWQGLIGCFVIVLISMSISSVGLYIFGLLKPEFLTSYITAATEYLRTYPPEIIEQIGKDVYESNLKALPATNLGVMIETYFLKGMLIGLFVSIILSVILRRTT
jgi:hypothetical protein